MQDDVRKDAPEEGAPKKDGRGRKKGSGRVVKEENLDLETETVVGRKKGKKGGPVKGSNVFTRPRWMSFNWFCSSVGQLVRLVS